MTRTTAALAAALLATPTFAQVTGDYVEARSASVYAGACHYNGEMTTAGREAVLVWNVRTGKLDGVPLDGLGVVAVIAGGDNLADKKNPRRSVLYLDARATPAQREALTRLATREGKETLGTISAVKTAPFRFEAQGMSLKVAAGNAARLDVSRYPCKHCLMPAQTWYEPFIPVQDAMVAQGIHAGYRDATLGVSWDHETSDNVYVGTFAL